MGGKGRGDCLIFSRILNCCVMAGPRRGNKGCSTGEACSGWADCRPAKEATCERRIGVGDIYTDVDEAPAILMISMNGCLDATALSMQLRLRCAWNVRVLDLQARMLEEAERRELEQEEEQEEEGAVAEVVL